MAPFPPPPIPSIPSPILAAAEQGGARPYLEMLHRLLDPGEWSVPTDTGFWWIPHRLRHEIELVQGNDQHTSEPALFCRSTITVAREITDLLAAFDLANYLNEKAMGGCAVVDPRTNTFAVVAVTQLRSWSWFDAEVFGTAMARTIGIAEHLAPYVAERSGGQVAHVVHPSLGERVEPDAFIPEMGADTFHFSAGTGLWWSRKEVQELKSMIAFVLSEFQRDDKAAEVMSHRYDDTLTSQQNFDTSVTWEAGDLRLRAAVKYADHHDYGAGLDLLLSTNITFPPEEPLPNPLGNTIGATEAANVINLMATQTCAAPLIIGGWAVAGSQLFLGMFLTADQVQDLQTMAGPGTGAVIGALLRELCHRIDEATDLLRTHWFATPYEFADDFVWSGVESSAGYRSLYVDDIAVMQSITSGLPLNQILEPIELDDDAWLLQHSRILMRYGLFNPYGPSVATLEVAINYNTQTALVLERIRHPISPSLKLYAVIDQNGFAELAPLVEQLVPALGWSGLEWAEIVWPDGEVREAIATGLIGLAQRIGVDFEYETALNIASASDPWLRLRAEPLEYRPKLPAGTLPEQAWLHSLTMAPTTDAFVAFLPQIWDGSRAMMKNDSAEADRLQAMHTERIMRRGFRDGRQWHEIEAAFQAGMFR